MIHTRLCFLTSKVTMRRKFSGLQMMEPGGHASDDHPSSRASKWWRPTNYEASPRTSDSSLHVSSHRVKITNSISLDGSHNDPLDHFCTTRIRSRRLSFDVSESRNHTHIITRRQLTSPPASMSILCNLRSWILFLCFLLSTIQAIGSAAAVKGESQGGIQSLASRVRRPRASSRRELQAFNYSESSGLRQDEAILLSWRNSSLYLTANWGVKNGTSDVGPCGWPRVGCGAWQGENRVTALNLASVNLTGPVPAQISRLEALTSLSFASNHLTGNIPPEIGNCVNLKVLNFTNNNLTGNIPVDLGRLAQLQRLDVSRNLLNGTIPPKMFTTSGCASLVYWNVSSNKLNGSVPSEVGMCTNLRIVDVGNNSLSGEIPSQMGLLPVLEKLIMSDNSNFNGSIPETLLESCQSLRSLDLAWSKFSGPLPPNLGNCTNLEALILQGNRFTGPVPDEFGKLTKLRVLALGNNNLTESLPKGLAKCSNLELLDVGNNQITGEVPTWLGELRHLHFVTLQINRFAGTIPVNVTTLPVLRYLDLSENFIQGSVLPEFGQVVSLRMLRLSGNNLTGSIPAELGNITHLQGLDLSSNHLNGSIPSSLGKLRDLLWLQLGNNSLTGIIPPELTNCSSLLWVNLAKNFLVGEIPAEFSTMGWDAGRVFYQNRENPWILDGVGECSIVSTWSPGQSQHFDTLLGMSDPQRCHSWLPLLVSGGWKIRTNKTSGESKVVGYWQLGKNGLSGPIPHFTRNTSTSTLAFLILSENRLTGSIPPELGNQPLYNLNVSQNHLNGSIPASLGNASLLVTLDMAYNNLSGTLPPELGELSLLSVLNVAYNLLLNGTIPSKGQFTTFGWYPYMGDINLCFNDSDPILKNILDHVNWQNGNLPYLCSQALKPSSENSTTTLAASGSGPVNGGEKPGKRKKIMTVLTIMLLSSLTTLTTLLLLYTCYCVFAKRRKEPYDHWDVTDESGKLKRSSSSQYYSSDHHHQVSLRHTAVASFGTPYLESLTYEHLLHATNNFSSSNIVGDGGFGIVYKAQLGNGTTVAIKKLIQNGSQGSREFQAEMETLGLIQHENLVSLLGYCRSGEEMLLVYEYFMNGSLDDGLYESDERAAQLLWPCRLRIALETARGLSFLHHECVHLIIHRDMKSSNILLNEHFKAVLTDFGMARIMDVDCSHVSTVVAGTPGYVPPEYSQTWRATTKGDVYSFGVVMLELLSGKRPTGPHFSGHCGSNLIEMTRILVSMSKSHEVMDPTVLSSGSGQQISTFLALALQCTEATPALRPTMLEVVQRLETISAMPGPDPSQSLIV